MIELHSHCCYSFLDGASHPHELVEQAVAYGYKAVALTDHNGLYGSMEFTQSAHAAGLQAITGAEITLDNEAHVTLLAETDEGYSNLCRIISLAHRENERLSPHLLRTELAAHAKGLIALSGCPQGEVPRLLDAGKIAEAERVAAEYREWFGAENYFLEAQHNLVQGDTARLRALAALGRKLKIPLAATGNTHYHIEERHRLQDVMVAIRHGMGLHEAQRYRRRNRMFALPEPEVFRARFKAVPEALETIETIAKRCESFDLTRDLGYQFPDFAREDSDTQGRLSADETLAQYCWEALEVKYAPPHHAHRAEAEQWLKNELRLVTLHGLGGFFLVYRDLLQMSKEVARDLRGGRARGKFDLPPGRGRGSAVSSIICYLIGLSSVDPVKSKLFPGRFLNESLASVPDIDIDFPRDIREELIRRVHTHYGNDHVAMVCIFPTYRFRGAVREVGKALSLPPAELDRLAKVGDAHGQVGEQLSMLSEFHSLTENPLWKHLTELSEQLWGMPRHLSQHVGGVVISSRPLVEIVPIEHSAMEGRQVCQWDKDSIDIARMIKVDFLALGMLSAVEECLDLIEANDKPALDLSRVPYDDAVLYNRICRGETVGAFQIESRAQIGMLVRTRPRTIEDLAIQVAIVRPGPVVANSVNPYVREREKQRTRRNYKPTYDHPLLEKTLADTLGIIIFQDQVMESCKALAGFTDGEADQLRRAMSRKRSRDNMERFRTRFIEGAAGKGVDPETALKVFEKVVAFSEFGFPKSHSAAFAVLAYQSMWLLHYYPAEFVTALLNAQPMGFYPPDTLIKDAQRRGIRFRVPDLNRSSLLSTVAGETVQLGLNTLKGVGEAKGEAILAEREAGGPFVSLPDFLRRTRVPDRVAESLILVGAMAEFGLNPRELLWQLGLLSFQRGEQFMTRTEGGLVPAARQLALDVPVEQDQVDLPPAGRWERLAHDYRLMALSVADHPVGLLRPLLRSRVVSIGDLRKCRDKSTVDVAGLVTTRQRPQTAKGILFLLLEDETGMLNVVCRKELWEAQRELFRTEPMLVIRGVLEQKDRRLNLVAEEAWPLSDSLPDPVKESASRRLHEALAAFQGPPAHNYR